MLNLRLLKPHNALIINTLNQIKSLIIIRFKYICNFFALTKIKLIL